MLLFSHSLSFFSPLKYAPVVKSFHLLSLVRQISSLSIRLVGFWVEA